MGTRHWTRQQRWCLVTGSNYRYLQTCVHIYIYICMQMYDFMQLEVQLYKIISYSFISYSQFCVFSWRLQLSWGLWMRLLPAMPFSQDQHVTLKKLGKAHQAWCFGTKFRHNDWTISNCLGLKLRNPLRKNSTYWTIHHHFPNSKPVEMSIWGFPKMGYPQSPSIYRWIFYSKHL